VDYDVSLLTGAQVANEVGMPNLANVAASAELDLDAITLNAHRWVFARLEGNGISPALLANESRLKGAVAAETLEMLFGTGMIIGEAGARASDAGGREYWGRRARDLVDTFRPRYTTADSPARAREGIPAVGHVSGGLTFSGDELREVTERFTGAVPEVSP
jgi:hypothetical protein